MNSSLRVGGQGRVEGVGDTQCKRVVQGGGGEKRAEGSNLPFWIDSRPRREGCMYSKQFECFPRVIKLGDFDGSVGPLTITIEGKEGKQGLTDLINEAMSGGFGHPFYMTRVIRVKQGEEGKLLCEEGTLEMLDVEDVSEIMNGNFIYVNTLEEIVMGEGLAGEVKYRKNGGLFIGTKEISDAEGVMAYRSEVRRQLQVNK